MNVGPPAAAGAPADAAGQVVAADQQPPDIDVVDTLAVAAQHDREAPVEPGGLDLDLRALAEFLVLEFENELRRCRLIGRFFPPGFGDRQGRPAQIGQRRRLGASPVEGGISQIDRYRAA